MKRLLFWVFVIQIGLYAAPAYAQFSLFEQQALKQIVSQWIANGSDIGGGSGHVIEDEGTPLTQRANINFTGAGITCTDSNPDTVCDVPAGSVDQAAAYTWTGAHSWRDANFSILDNADTSKILKFELSGISGSTTRTLTIPNASGTVALTTSNVATATALAANGANCSAGQFPLGVDASGAAESCTALPTTIAGTANQITASAATGAITLSIPTSPTLPGTTTGTFSGPLAGNVTSSGTSTFTGAILIPGKADPGSPITNEVWRSTTSPVGFKYYDGSTIQRAIMDSNFSSDGIMMRGIGSGNYSILAVTDDTLPVANGTVFQSKTLPACTDTGGQHLNYDTATNTFSCGTTSGSGLTSVTEDADSVNIAKTTEVGVQTNNVALTRGGSISGSVTYTLAKNTSGDVGLTTGTLTQNQLASFDGSERSVASGTTKWFKAYWDGGAITPDGTFCADPTKQTLNSGPTLYTFSCADNNSSIFYGQVQLTRDITTAVFTLTLFHAASESITFAGDFSAMCRGDNTVINSTWGTAVAADVALVTTANQTQAQSTTSVTPNGTCTSGAILYWRYVVDAANFSANAANSKVLGVLMVQDS